MNHYTYLALGDSYTIGEQVSLTESFPYQTVQLLRKAATGQALAPGPGGLQITAPEIIAKTGWTTGELLAATSQLAFLPAYDFVSLLIGVNNQYRGGSVEEFRIEFGQLLQLAIHAAAGNRKKVFILSIPDWGLTPFAEGKDRRQVSAEIDAYNAACKDIAEKNKCVYIDITISQRADAGNIEFLAADMLHPSGKEYAKWASLLSEAILLSL